MAGAPSLHQAFSEMSEQQRETLSFFDATAAQWRAKAEGKVEKVNIIAQRNGCVLRVRERLAGVKRFLDLGCGTGELVLDMAATGVHSLGVDFAPEMIAACNGKLGDSGTRNASFRCQSIFDIEEADGSYDIISGVGLIEYISAAELDRLLANVFRMLRPGGAFIVGSRNRLFNLFSLNDYTRLEQKLGTADGLLTEAIAIASAPDMGGAIDAARSTAKRLPQPDQHPGTGIGVGIRYQYTPGELDGIVAAHGFRTATLFPVHYHPMPAAAKDAHHGAHIAIANGLNEIAGEDHRLIPQSSSFVLDARKG